MDYVKLYTKICEHHSNQIDFINFIENKMEEINRKMGVENDKLMIDMENLRQTIERVKLRETLLLKEVTELEIMVEVAKKNGL